MADLRIALVGAGFWARYQLAAWREVPGVQCVAVCDLDQEKARSVAETAGITAHVHRCRGNARPRTA